MSIETVLEQAMLLSPRDRAALAEELWRRSIPDESQVALTPEQAEDLDRRIAEDEAGESDPVGLGADPR